MLPDRVSNPGPLTYESGALPIALRGPASRYLWSSVNSLYIVHFPILGPLSQKDRPVFHCPRQGEDAR